MKHFGRLRIWNRARGGAFQSLHEFIAFAFQNLHASVRFRGFLALRRSLLRCLFGSLRSRFRLVQLFLERRDLTSRRILRLFERRYLLRRRILRLFEIFATCLLYTSPSPRD